MMDSAKIWDVEITDADATRFLQELVPNNRCRNGHTDSFSFGVIPPGGGEYLSLSTTLDGGGPGKNHLPIFTVTCEICGLTDVYSAGPLVEWKRQQLEASKDGDG